jgi:NADH-quinone oxidoreductase subunit C
MSKDALKRLTAAKPDAVIDSHDTFGDETAVVRAESLFEVMSYLRDNEALRFEMLTDVTAVDYLDVKIPRFEVVYHLYSLSKNHRLRVKVQLTEDSPAVPSVLSLWKSANWMEREVWDLYGIRFDGHPDLRRILTYSEFEGHPLRKDYDMEKRQPLVEPRAGRKHL